MTESISPIRKQLLDIKSQYPDCMLLFRLGDFYETFDEDAENASKVLNIVLTKKAMGKGVEVPMAGIPYHALDDYMSRLIKAGYKLAICEQLTKPGETKGLVQRDVVRIVTPGTIIEPALLEKGINNYLASVIIENDSVGLAYIDVSTGEFGATEIDISKLQNELVRINPAEIIIPEDQTGIEHENITKCSAIDFRLDRCEAILKEQFEVTTLEGFGLKGHQLATRAAGAVVRYVRRMQKDTLGILQGINYYSTASYMALDNSTQKNLELFENSTGNTKDGTLLSVLDHTTTPMGMRLMRRWIGQPSLDKKEIERRQNIVEAFTRNSILRSRIITILKNIPDIERIANRITSNIVLPRELLALKYGLKAIPELAKVLSDDPAFKGLIPNEQSDIVFLLESSLNDPIEGLLGDGTIIRHGYSQEYDEIKDLVTNSKKYLMELEAKEKSETGISKLRVGFNSVFGYYIEVPNGAKSQVPDTYIRKQTLANVERYYTPELKEYETLILHANENISDIEHRLYRQITSQITPYLSALLTIAHQISELDVLRSFAEVAVLNRYVRPKITDEKKIEIVNGRHPVVETRLPSGTYVPNDTRMDHSDTQIMLITGPNMAGKSTYMKQVALIVLMTQIGSYVPADRAELSIIDRIFTRIGAHEELSSGKSTFMVEMVETSVILNNATPNSLLLLDEIGRGTSTYDGLSIAESVVEYIHNNPKKAAFTLFATHYHEMVSMSERLPRLKNFNIAVAEENDEIVLLHKIIKGGTDKSYGIHVAKLAGLPRSVTARANEILEELEQQPKNKKVKNTGMQAQLPLFAEPSPTLKKITEMDLDDMTPRQALNTLYELKKESKEELSN
ncbi:MAG: DNA mismatch repair protein MutS [Dehalococcoidales bacterium]|nr:DNA mismatch repair protein MutS [Dehalococcoidales bacterium]